MPPLPLLLLLPLLPLPLLVLTVSLVTSPPESDPALVSEEVQATAPATSAAADSANM